MKNINELHRQAFLNKYTRSFPSSKHTIMSGKSSTKKLSQTEIKELMQLVESGEFVGEASLIVNYSTEKEANKIAKSFKRLTENPAFKLNVTFQKIKNENT